MASIALTKSMHVSGHAGNQTRAVWALLPPLEIIAAALPDARAPALPVRSSIRLLTLAV